MAREEAEVLPFFRTEPSQGSNCPFSETYEKLIKLPVVLTAKTFASAGATYALLGIVAIVYYNGLWLVIPVGLGGAVGLTDAMVTILAKKYPDNEFIQSLNKKVFVANKICVAYLGDLGFTFNALKTVGQFITDQKYIKYFKTITLPSLAVLSIIPAGMIRMLRVKDERGTNERSFSRHASSFFRGATASAALNVFEMQGLLGPMIPSIAIAVGGIMGLISSLIKEGSPKIALSIMMLINLLGENSAIATIVFSLVNDVVAGIAEERYENGAIESSELGIPEPFFYTNLAMCILFYGALCGMSVEKLLTPEEPEPDAQEMSINP